MKPSINDSIDRLSLLMAYERPQHKRLNLYSLTPDTSIPIRKGHRRDGRKEERALIHALVEREWEHVLADLGKDFFQGSATSHWKHAVAHQGTRAANGSLREAFRRSFGVACGLRPARNRTFRLSVRHWSLALPRPRRPARP